MRGALSSPVYGPNIDNGPYTRGSQAQRLCNAIQLAFLNDSLVRFIGIFNPVLAVVAFGWQELRNLINAVRAPATEGSGDKTHRLTDFEFMSVHEALHRVQWLCMPPCRWNQATSIVCFMAGTYTTKLPGGVISTGSISWSNSAPCLGG
jgi:hypothetical protein